MLTQGNSYASWLANAKTHKKQATSFINDQKIFTCIVGTFIDLSLWITCLWKHIFDQQDFST